MSDLAARVRAARGYADLTQPELADRLGLEKQSIVRTEGGSRDPKKAELIAIAHICGVPVEFMTGGFGQVTRDELRDLLERIEDHLAGGEIDSTTLEIEAAAETDEGPPGEDERADDARGQAGSGS